MFAEGVATSDSAIVEKVLERYDARRDFRILIRAATVRVRGTTKLSISSHFPAFTEGCNFHKNDSRRVSVEVGLVSPRSSRSSRCATKYECLLVG
jgi:hypothetical protein